MAACRILTWMCHRTRQETRSITRLHLQARDWEYRSNLSQGIGNVTRDIYNITKAPSISIQGDAVVEVPVNWTKVIIVNNTGNITVKTLYIEKLRT